MVFQRMAVALDAKDPKSHLNSEDASYRGHSCFRGKAGGNGKVRNKIEKNQEKNGVGLSEEWSEEVVTEGKKPMLFLELKGWVYREICCSSFWKQKISCVSLWFSLCVSFSTQGAIVLQF